MTRPVQILIGIILLSLALVLGLMSMIPDETHFMIVRQLSALLAGLLGFVCVVSWGRPYTTRVALGLLALAMLAMAFHILMSDKLDIGPVVFAGMVALMSGGYAVTGYYPESLPMSAVFGARDNQRSREEVSRLLDEIDRPRGGERHGPG